MKKKLYLLLALVLSLGLLTFAGCGDDEEDGDVMADIGADTTPVEVWILCGTCGQQDITLESDAAAAGQASGICMTPSSKDDAGAAGTGNGANVCDAFASATVANMGYQDGKLKGGFGSFKGASYDVDTASTGEPDHDVTGRSYTPLSEVTPNDGDIFYFKFDDGGSYYMVLKVSTADDTAVSGTAYWNPTPNDGAIWVLQ